MSTTTEAMDDVARQVVLTTDRVGAAANRFGGWDFRFTEPAGLPHQRMMARTFLDDTVVHVVQMTENEVVHGESRVSGSLASPAVVAALVKSALGLS